MVHDLKQWPEPFADTVAGKKMAEVRRNDRGYKVGDTLVLKEYDPQRGYTGKVETREISHIQEGFGLPAGLVVLSFAIVGIAK